MRVLPSAAMVAPLFSRLSPFTRASRFLVAALLALAALPADAGPTLDRIRSKGTIVFAYRDGAAPFSFKDRAGHVRGYSVELCSRVAAALSQRLGLASLKVDWLPVNADQRLEAVASGRADAECGTTTITLSRMETVDFSLPIFVTGGTVIVPGKSAIAKLSDLAGKRVAVIAGTTTERALVAALNVQDATAVVVPVRTSSEGVAELVAGKVDAYAADRLVLLQVQLRNATDQPFNVLPGDYSYEPYGLVLPRGDPDFRLAVNRALVDLYKRGEIDPIYQRWLAPLGPPGPLLNAMFYLNALPD
jgi:ABC-type amino acid transport substrate-binding protein